MSSYHPNRAVLGLAVAALALGGSACAHVGQDDFDSEVAELRGMISDGDRQNQEQTEALAARLESTEERMRRLESELNALSSEISGMEVEVDRLGSAVRAHVPIHFGFDESEIPEEGRELVRRFASVVAEHYPTAYLTVEGFTDPAGPAEYNLQLGLARAESVRAGLTENGLDPERIRTVTYGEDTRRLMTQRGSPDGAGRENRRVVIAIDAISPEMGWRPSTSASTGAGAGTGSGS
ncbi:MAG: OmpA family protein [Longimicrobiales bacterium]|nr:OmpA family protein [Longimicrobiales bacterium]